MISAMWAFVCATLAAITLTPIVRRYALRWGAVDEPGGRRVNQRTIPRLGGIGLAAAFYAALAFIFIADTAVAQRFFASAGPSVGLLVGGVLMCLVGVLDDTRGLRALHKLGAQILAAGVAYAAGFRIEALNLPFIDAFQLGMLSPLVTALWIVAVINAINLIDGLDGLAGGVTFFVCVTHFVVAFLNNDPFLMLLSASLGGAVFGFLFFNFNPASIFMGDSGSLFLGYILATTSILSASVKSTTTVSILVPLIALGLPLMDTLLAIVRRLLRRQSIFAADRGHIHHILLSLGFTHRRAVLTLYAVCVFLAMGAIGASFGRQREAGILLLVLSMVGVGVVAAAGVIVQAANRFRLRELGWGVAVDSLRLAVPEILHALREAADREAVLTGLRLLVDSGPMRAVELTGSRDEALAEECSLQRADDAAGGQHLVSVFYPLPAAGERAQLAFQWANEEPSLSGEAAILLQLVVDACNAALLRTVAPHRESESERVAQVARKTTVRSELRGARLLSGPQLVEAHSGRGSKP